MKKILILSITILLNTGTIFSNPINVQTAEIVAINFMKNRGNYSAVLDVLTEKLDGATSFYVVNFIEGGWVIVSSDDLTVPVLGYNLIGNYKIEDDKPLAFIEFINVIKDQIVVSIKSNMINSEVKQKWEKLMYNSSYNPTKSYTPGSQLLNVSGRGHVIWAQDLNNDGGCSPAYNAHCPYGSNAGCECDKKPVGCGAVAMGQIMWYWQWPQSSMYRTYNWELMPSELNNNSSDDEGNEVAHLLRDCGAASNMTYWCAGSWTTTNKIEDAFKDKFNYKTVKKHKRSDWDYGNSWMDLLRSEINAERPIFYRGDRQDIGGEKHFFVLDGYDANDADFFWFNFGWGYSGAYNIARFYLNDLTPGGLNLNENQMAIVGISPTYEEVSNPISNVNIIDVPFTNVTGIKILKAQQNILLPADGKSLTVKNGGDLTMVAGNSIKLKEGFSSELGSKFSVRIDPDYTNAVEMDITVPTWYDIFTPNGDGVNDVLCFDVENADSWEFAAFNRDDDVVFKSAGTISDNVACVWDGTGACDDSGFQYNRCIIRFKNSYGRVVENDYLIAVVCPNKSNGIDSISTGINMPISQKESINSVYVNIHPNPNNGLFTVTISSDSANEEFNIEILSIEGKRYYKNLVRVENTKTIEVDIRNLNSGIYVLRVFNDKTSLVERIVKN